MKRKCLELFDKPSVGFTALETGTELCNPLNAEEEVCDNFVSHHHERKRRRRESEKKKCNIFSDSFSFEQLCSYTSDFNTNSKEHSLNCDRGPPVGSESVFVHSSFNVNCGIQESMDSLRSNLIELGMTPSPRFETSMRQRFTKRSESDRIKMKISLNLKEEEDKESQRKEQILCRVSEDIKTSPKNFSAKRLQKPNKGIKRQNGKGGTSIFHWFKSTRGKRHNTSRRNFKTSGASNTENDDTVRPMLFCMF